MNRKPAAPLVQQLDPVDRPNEVVLDQLAAAGLAINPGENAGVNGSFDNPIAPGAGFRGRYACGRRRDRA